MISRETLGEWGIPKIWYHVFKNFCSYLPSRRVGFAEFNKSHSVFIKSKIYGIMLFKMSLPIKLQSYYQPFLQWLVTPDKLKSPLTEKEWIEKNKLNPLDTAIFRKQESFDQDYLNEKLRWARKKTPELLDVLYNEYITGKDPADLRLWQELVEEFQNSTTGNGGGDTDLSFIKNISDEQRRQIITRAATRIGLIKEIV